MIKKSLIFLCCSLVNLAWGATDAVLLGVTLPQHITITQTAEKLMLNGYAAAKLWGDEAYVGALYTTHLEKRPQMLLIKDDAVAMIFYFVKDDISAQMLRKAIVEGIIVNNGGWENKWLDKSRLLALKEVIQQNFNAGDVLAFYYSPKNGLLMLVNNEVQYHWPHGKSLINMLLRMWVGPYPPSREFKNEILNITTHPYRMPRTSRGT